MHSGNGEHTEIDDNAVRCFTLALDAAGFSGPALRATLEAYFRWALTAMARYPKSADAVPTGMPLARWSWDGPAV